MSAAASPGDLDKATRILKAKQHEYYIQWVRDALETERQRKTRLEKATSRDECTRLERQFEKERAKDKERLRQIQEDHQLILQAKISEWSLRGVPESALMMPPSGATPGPTPTSGAVTHSAQESSNALVLDSELHKPETKRKVSKATLERLSSKPPAAILGSDHTNAQQLAFHKDVIRKQDHLRLHRGQSTPTLNHANLQTLSETALLERKAHLLSQLHGVVSQQERMILDDQCTVRSAVSSWKSADFQSVRSNSSSSR